MSNSLSLSAKKQLIDRFLGTNADKTRQLKLSSRKADQHPDIPEKFTRFDQHPNFQKVVMTRAVAERFDVPNPFFRAHDGVACAKMSISGREYINYSNYNYLGLAGHSEVNSAAKDAIERYGTSASASRLVAGELPIQRELERAIADTYEVDDCIVFVSGHATNVSTIGAIFGPKDLIVHDSLIHNSVLEGIKVAGSARRSFPHNNTKALDKLLTEIRGRFERVLVVAEGLYSMDGDVLDLPELVKIKNRHKAFLMVDEAHSFGVLGATGKGIREHYGVESKDVDIWMGTLSKTLAGCGGFIAGETALIEQLKYFAPGFVYSVGMAPPLAAASLQALKIMKREPERVRRLSEVAQFFLEKMKDIGVMTGYAGGHAVVPLILGSSVDTTRLSHQLFEAGINVQPIIFPAVEEKSSRLRFFLSAMHTDEDIQYTVNTVERLLEK